MADRIKKNKNIITGLYYLMMKYYITTHFIVDLLFIRSTMGQTALSREKKSEDICYSLEICKICYPEKKDVTVLIGNWSKVPIINTKIYQSEFNVVSLVGLEASDNLEDYASKPKYYIIDPSSKLYKPHPANKITIVEVELSFLVLALYKLKETIWWNIYSHYFIENTMEYDTCKRVHEVLQIVWEFDIVSAIFTCNNGDRVETYTFNPFSNYASSVWKEDRTYVQKNLHPFVLYKLTNNSIDSPRYCEYLFFDKTIILNDYPVKILGRNLVDTPYDPNEKSPYKIRGMVGVMFQEILTKLNVSINLTVSERTFVSHFDSKGTPYGIFKFFFDNKFDILLAFYEESSNSWKNKIYANVQSPLCYTSKKNMMTLQKYVRTVFSTTFLTIAVTIFILAATFAYFIKYSIIEILLDILRLITGTKSIYVPQTKLEHLIFLMMIFIIMTLSFFFQNQLTSMMSAPTYQPVINAVDDIIKFNYTGVTDTTRFLSFKDTVYEKYLRKTDGFDNCLIKLKQAKRIVCIKSCYLTRYRVRDNHNTHVAVDDRYVHLFVHLVRDDFSLQKRITLIYNRLQESGFYIFIQNNKVKYNVSRINNIYTRQIISIEHVTFMFIFLTWGYSLACAIFVAEKILKVSSYHESIRRCN